MKRKIIILLIMAGTLTFFNCFDDGGGGGDTPQDPGAASYTITFDKNDAGATGTMAQQTIAEGGTENLDAVGFDNPGWAFIGWATTSGGSVEYDDGDPYTMGSANVTLYAKWSNTTDLTATSVTLHGSGNPNGKTMLGWFRYATANPGTCNDAFGTRAPATGGSDLGNGTTLVGYSKSITGLTSKTTYYFCSIVTDYDKTSFGPMYSFKTP
jgi:uncharacterized repeat protein (TIGR02543 family)